MRADGKYVDDSSECADRVATAQDQITCQQALSHVPHDLADDMNKGLSTLQFQSVAISQQRPLHQVIGGTQDNGTFDWDGSQAQIWWQTMYGDGGQSGIDATDDSIMFNQFTAKTNDNDNFRGGQPKWWVVVSGSSTPRTPTRRHRSTRRSSRIPGCTASASSACSTSGRMQDNGGDQAYLEANCPEFITFANDPRCGDFVALGDTNGAPHLRNEPGDLTSATNGYGADRPAGTSMPCSSRASGTPIRTPFRSSASGIRTGSVGPTDVESQPSLPAIAWYASAASRTVRANGPTWSSEDANAIRPWRETAP